MVQGIGVAGNDIFVRRVRVINWGTQTPLFEYGASPRALECFPIFIGGDAIIEDCILEQPNPNNARESTCLSALNFPAEKTKTDAFCTSDAL